MKDSATASDLIDLTMALHHETEKAILVSDDGDPKRGKWLPKSAVEFVRVPEGKVAQRQVGGPKYPVVEVTMPEWLAIDKGLV